MTTAEKLLLLKSDFDEVYSAGYEKGKTEGGGDNTMLDSIIEKTITHLESQTATSVGNLVFSDFTPIQSVYLPMVKTIGDYAFRRCPNLTSVNIPNCLALGTECFYGDKNLIYIDLPKVTTIYNGVFAGGTALETLVIRTPKVCELKKIAAFNSTKIANGEGYIYVPDDLVESYKSATNWSTYANQIKGLSELEEVIE